MFVYYGGYNFYYSSNLEQFSCYIFMHCIVSTVLIDIYLFHHRLRAPISHHSVCSVIVAHNPVKRETIES